MKHIIWILLSASLWAQTLNNRAVQPFVDGQVGAYDALGYTNPILVGGGGLDIESRHVFVTATGRAEWARKIETGDGHAYHAQGAAYAKFGRLLLGGGDAWSKEITSKWSKTAQRPILGGGYDGESIRFIADYSLPFLDKQNGLQGLTGTLEFKVTKHLRLVLKDGLFYYHDTFGPHTHFGAETFGGVKFAF